MTSEGNQIVIAQHLHCPIPHQGLDDTRSEFVGNFQDLLCGMQSLGANQHGHSFPLVEHRGGDAAYALQCPVLTQEQFLCRWSKRWKASTATAQRFQKDIPGFLK
jgi:hypothetical protein